MPGVPGTVTIATNMAGRGTDIQLGGNIDMRLAKWRDEQRGLGIEPTAGGRGRATRRAGGRDRAPARRRRWPPAASSCSAPSGTRAGGSTTSCAAAPAARATPAGPKFFLSCEDDLLRIFAGDRLDAIMRTFGVEEGEAITHRWLNSAIATAQKRVEQRNYEIRKNLLKYDDVVNDQRKAVFEQRHEFMVADDLSEIVVEMRSDTIDDIVAPLTCRPRPTPTSGTSRV